MRKKIIVLWMIICMSVMMFVGCGGDNTTGNSSEENVNVDGNDGENEIVGDVEWKIENGVLTISGTGMMESCYLTNNPEWKEKKDVPWLDEMRDIKKVVIEEGVTTIGYYAFWYCYGLEEIQIPEGITTIGSWAFGNIDIEDLNLPNSLVRIEDEAFSHLAHYSVFNEETYSYDWIPLEIPENVTYIGARAFETLTNIRYVSLPEGLTYIGEGAFKNASSIGDDLDNVIRIPSTVESVSDQLFYDCESMRKIELAEGVKSIGKEAFYNCIRLGEIVIPESVTYIAEDAFSFDAEEKEKYDYNVEQGFEPEQMPLEHLVIYGVTGSYAEEFAREQGYVFVPIK